MSALLLRKGHEDLHAARVFAADPEHADHIIGFHVQQAIEKAIKAVLAADAIDIPRSHDLAFLTSLVPQELGFPGDADTVRWLSPWGVAWRYDDPVDQLDVALAIATAASVVAWAAGQLAG